MPRLFETRALSRRHVLRAGLLAAGALSLAGCDAVAENDRLLRIVDAAEGLTYRAQRLILPRDRLAPEYSRSDIAATFRANGAVNPSDPSYRSLVDGQFAGWQLTIGGLVDTPLKFSLADLRVLPAQTQITRHDCVEGWSCIGEWTGVPLSELLKRTGIKPQARYVVFHCADTWQSGTPLDLAEDGFSTGSLSEPDHYYESIDLVDAFHPQTILAYQMNGSPLPVAYGAPLRLRVERQLGYKMAKYVMAIELVHSFAGIGGGKGGYWEDLGYDWYAGI